MTYNDRLLADATTAVGVVMASLTVLSYVLDWPSVVQLTLPLLLVVVLNGMEFARKRARRRR